MIAPSANFIFRFAIAVSRVAISLNRKDEAVFYALCALDQVPMSLEARYIAYFWVFEIFR